MTIRRDRNRIGAHRLHDIADRRNTVSSVVEVGHSTHMAPLNRCAAAPSRPSCSLPAIGCPATKRGSSIDRRSPPSPSRHRSRPRHPRRGGAAPVPRHCQPAWRPPQISRRQGVKRADLVDDTAIDRIGEAACVKIDADDVPALVPQRKAHGSSDEAHTDDHGLFGVSHDNAGYRGGSEPVAGFSDADATSSDRTSSRVSSRHSPARRGSVIGPIRVRTSRTTGWPTASHIRRTCRFRPSWIVMRSRFDSTAVTRARAVGPSSRSTPSRNVRSEAARVHLRPEPGTPSRRRSWGG